MRRDAIDLRLYLVTDPRLPDDELLGRVEGAVRAGVTLVQIRLKNEPTERVAVMADRLRGLLDPLAVPLIVNDDVEAARLAGAAGVHLGQSDASPAFARERLGPDAIIGLSLECIADADRVDPAVDYVAASPVFATQTKLDIAPPLGLDGVAALRGRCSLPLIGIGGIDAHNVGDVIRAGADGVAVVSAILGAPEPADAARRLRRAVDEALSSRGRTRAG